MQRQVEAVLVDRQHLARICEEPIPAPGGECLVNGALKIEAYPQLRWSWRPCAFAIGQGEGLGKKGGKALLDQLVRISRGKFTDIDATHADIGIDAPAIAVVESVDRRTEGDHHQQQAEHQAHPEPASIATKNRPSGT